MKILNKPIPRHSRQQTGATEAMRELSPGSTECFLSESGATCLHALAKKAGMKITVRKSGKKFCVWRIL